MGFHLLTIVSWDTSGLLFSDCLMPWYACMDYLIWFAAGENFNFRLEFIPCVQWAWNGTDILCLNELEFSFSSWLVTPGIILPSINCVLMIFAVASILAGWIIFWPNGSKTYVYCVVLCQFWCFYELCHPKILGDVDGLCLAKHFNWATWFIDQLLA